MQNTSWYWRGSKSKDTNIQRCQEILPSSRKSKTSPYINIIHTFFPFTLGLQNSVCSASLVVQWLRVCLAMQGHQFSLWSGKIPYAKQQLNPCTTTTEPIL